MAVSFCWTLVLCTIPHICHTRYILHTCKNILLCLKGLQITLCYNLPLALNFIINFPIWFQGLIFRHASISSIYPANSIAYHWGLQACLVAIYMCKVFEPQIRPNKLSNMRSGPPVVKVTQRISSLDLIRALCKILLFSLENIIFHSKTVVNSFQI